jgi:hypothetical protein
MVIMVTYKGTNQSREYPALCHANAGRSSQEFPVNYTDSLGKDIVDNKTKDKEDQQE